MARRPLNRRDLRAAAEAAEARGIPLGPESGSRPRSRPESSSTSRPKSSPTVRMKVVWAVCDVGGRTVATFDYADKASAEVRAAELKAKGKGSHFVRSVKEPIGHSGTSSAD